MSALWLLFCIIAVANARDGWWRQIFPPGSEPGAKQGSAGAVLGDSLYVLGGDTKTSGFLQYYTYKWTPEATSWSRLTSSSVLPTNFMYSDVDSVGGLLFLFGGQNAQQNQSGYFNDIYTMNPLLVNPNWTFVEVDSNVPDERNGHTATEIDGLVYVFGGWNQVAYYNDLWSFDTAALINGGNTGSWVSYTLSTKPAPRDGHTGVDFGGDLVIFGGFSHNTQGGTNAWTNCKNASDDCKWFNDLWFFNTVKNTWKQASPSGSKPAPRHMHSADVIGDRMLVFGGASQQGDLNDLWSYQFSRNEWVQLQPSGVLPQPRNSHVAGVIGGVLYIYGGSTGSQDTWSFTLNVEQKYEEEEAVNLDPLTGAAVFNVLVIFAIAVVVFFTFKHIRGGGSTATEKDTTINEIE
jgi:N-acetylneuraminic acid mutarotase